jgi:hypothetical protein
MALRAKTRSTANLVAPHGYDRVMKSVHWSVLLLISSAYIAIWASHTV